MTDEESALLLLIMKEAVQQPMFGCVSTYGDEQKTTHMTHQQACCQVESKMRDTSAMLTRHRDVIATSVPHVPSKEDEILI